MSHPAVDRMELGYARTALRRRLVEATLRQEKTATSSLVTDYEPFTAEKMPVVGTRYALLDFDDRPVGIVEVTEVTQMPAKDVGLEFARDEGEGFGTVAEWRGAHELFWHDHKITDETLIVCERFRLIEPEA